MWNRGIRTPPNRLRFSYNVQECVRNLLQIKHDFSNLGICGQSFVRGSFGKFLARHPQCVDKMLSIIHFWKLEFIGYLMVWFLSKKDLVCTCSACSKWVGVYILAEILSKILEKSEGKLGTLFAIMIWQINESVQTYFFLEYIMRSLLARLPPLHSENVD